MSSIAGSLTVVVTCFEANESLARALESTRAEGTFTIILVDDGSTSCSCFNVARNFTDLVHVVRDNGGHPAALNTGVELVSTEFVAFLDSDDLWVDGRIDRHGAILDDSKVDCVVGGVVNVTERAGVEVERQVFPATRVLGAMTMRTAALERVGTFDEGLAHHFMIDWWSRAADTQLAIVKDDEPALIRRIHGANTGLLQQHESREHLMQALRTHRVRKSGGLN